ncbi:MAG: TetR/AcrR family transcriptional regulator [Cyclobacteriaceae bacterium]
MAGRPKIVEEKELLQRATEVFWEKGYYASSAQDLMSAMGIGQGSFYRAFPGGKKELYQKTLLLFLENSLREFYADLEASEDPVAFIRKFFYEVVARSDQSKANGCYLGNAIIELTNLDEDTRELSEKLLSKLKDGFEKALTIAQKKGTLSNVKSPELIAAYLLNFWNGINVTQRTNICDGELRDIIAMNLKILS